jgi:hypothetical protein
MAQKPLLTKRMRRQRLEFVMACEDWTVNDWKQVMFSDECYFELQFWLPELLLPEAFGVKIVSLGI